jgi:hypothetical protein
MSNSGYNPKVVNPNMSNNIPQMRSEAFQKPFYFGASQVPINLALTKQSYSGSGFVGNKPSNKNIPIFRDDGKPMYVTQSIDRKYK